MEPTPDTAAGEPPLLEDPRIRIDRPLETQDLQPVLDELRSGLTAEPRWLPSKYFYDDHGSELFVEITKLPEYYQTRAERALLVHVADDIIAHTGARELVEIGSGAASKTQVLLDAMERCNQLSLFVPMDVSEGIVLSTSRDLLERYPGLHIHGVVGDFMNHLGEIPDTEKRLVIFLGGTIGNLPPEAARGFLRDLGRQMNSGEYILLGMDRIKDRERLEAAYNDSAGVTAAFNRNILRVVNRLAGGDFDPELFRHKAIWNADAHRIEMWLIAEADQEVRLEELDLDLRVRRGEEMLTEISTKYDRDLATGLLNDSGYDLDRWYSDPNDLFALCLAVKR